MRKQDKRKGGLQALHSMMHSEPEKLTSLFSRMEDMWFVGREDGNTSLILTVHISRPSDVAEARMNVRSREVTDSR